MMRSVSLTHVVPAVALMGILSGCYHHSPYGYGGHYGAPGPYSPYQTLTPGQPYVPGGGTPGMVVPQGTPPTFEGGGGGLQPIPDNNTNGGSNGGSAPPFGSDSGGNMNVPDPYFPNTNSSSSYNPQSPAGNGIQPATHMHAEPAPLRPGVRELKARPMNPANTAANPWPNATPEPTGSTAPDPVQNPHATAGASTAVAEETFTLPRTASDENAFHAGPAPADSAPAPEGAQPMFEFQANKVSASEQPPFAHDPEYEWLQGVVSFEPQDGVWSIVYNDNPEPDDQFAGHVSLAPSPYLEQLKEGDVVKVDGQIDPLVRDSLGKPIYLISRLTRLTPRDG